MRALIALLVVALLAACMGPTFIVQQYNGPPRARETIATLRVNGAEPVRLLFLDEEDVAAPLVSDGRLHIELLPGKHTLMARNGDDRRGEQGLPRPRQRRDRASLGGRPRLRQADP